MKILVADDHAYNRDLLTFVLEDEGHECIHAENGEQVIELYQRQPDIELMLMDVNMPVMDGISATKKVKESVDDRLLTIIFVTALDNPEVLVKCLDAGGDDFVPKPIDETILVSKLKAHARSQEMYNNLHKAHEELRYHKSLMDREHKIVEHVFNSGTNLNSVNTDNVSFYTSSMSMFNGDVVLTAPSPSGGVYLLVADFTGHGLSAAIGCLPLTGIFYDLTAKQGSVGQIADALNSRLREVLPLEMFCCATIIHADQTGQNLNVWSGGMNPILALSPDGKQITASESDYMPLGILDDEEFDKNEKLLNYPLDTKLYIYSDGVNEAKNTENEEFGQQRVKDLLTQCGENRIQHITSAVRDFTGNEELGDDLSIVEFSCESIIHRDKETGEVIDVGAAYRSAECFPWVLSVTLTATDLRRTDIVRQVLAFLSTIEGIELHQDKLFTILSELYSNSLEHGVLGLDSKIKCSPQGFEEYYRLRQERLTALTDDAIKIDMCYVRGEPNRIEMVITDSGDGFDFNNLDFEDRNDDERHGRGLHLLHSLCEKLEYSNGGRTVTAVYEFV